jgi:hypothetical protein
LYDASNKFLDSTFLSPSLVVQVGIEIETERYLVTLEEPFGGAPNPNQIIPPTPTPSVVTKAYVPPSKPLGAGLKKRRQPSLSERLQNQDEHLRKVRKDQGFPTFPA